VLLPIPAAIEVLPGSLAVPEVLRVEVSPGPLAVPEVFVIEIPGTGVGWGSGYVRTPIGPGIPILIDGAVSPMVSPVAIDHIGVR
jgi:hypothetical protein